MNTFFGMYFEPTSRTGLRITMMSPGNKDVWNFLFTIFKTNASVNVCIPSRGQNVCKNEFINALSHLKNVSLILPEGDRVLKKVLCEHMLPPHPRTIQNVHTFLEARIDFFLTAGFTK